MRKGNHNKRISTDMSTDMVRWTVSVSRETDIAVRGFLAQHGMKKGDLSRFIEEAVRWRVFDRTMAEARSGFADMEPDALEDLIGEAVTATLATDKSS
ncbi:hypothetical protein AA11826_0785 [Komagataeibacter oboediens DSM 11826]|nr:hypothetical protein AA18890_3462 [Komagataeibacter europaeus LMG 18890]GBR31421.1 hypothetical protein AA11826_0785 [Komagataeibacter oboediens DSM 11826]